MSSNLLCSQLSTIVAHVHQIAVDAPKYDISFDSARLQTLRQKESRLRMEIYRSTGFPAYQLCETNEQCVSDK